MILTKTQAETIYRAMCELNNIGGRLVASTLSVTVTQHLTGFIWVSSADHPTEGYSNQASFASAYGLK